MIRLTVVYLVLSILAVGCSTKRPAVGSGGTLVAVADPVDRPVVRKAINAAFQRTVATPQPEPMFNIVWTDGDLLQNHTRSPLILLTSTLDGTGSTAKLLGRMLTPDVRSGVESGDYSVFTRRDPWAGSQLLLIVAGNSNRELAEQTELWGDSLFQWAVDFEIERIQQDLFRRKEQKKLSEELLQQYGFKLRIQHDYVIAQSNDSLDFVRFIRYHPERWFSVAWGEISDGSELTPQFIYNRRKQIGTVFLDPVIHYDDHWTSERSVLNGFDATLVRGLWATVGPTGGGPFFSYGLWNSETEMYYIVSGSVFVPDDTKMKYLWQLDAIANTFQIKQDNK